jgi:hypothetical protein
MRAKTATFTTAALLLMVNLLTRFSLAQTAAAVHPDRATRAEIVLVSTDAINDSAVRQWKREGFNAVALDLDERAYGATDRALAERIAQGGLALYYWIEVARNPTLAEQHPRWMASLGMHDDWQRNFPNTPKPNKDQVAKAFPWVPITYRDAFDAHLARIEKLLASVPPGYRGLLLNDLQAGPSSCGCGNLQCRWATDYHVPATANTIEGHDAAAKFVAEVRKRAPGRTIIPVWTTECEEVDLPAPHRRGAPTTGLCGTVGCAVGLCPKEFTRQWSALASSSEGPLAVLALHGEFQRAQNELGGGFGWLTNALAYLERVPPAQGGKAVPRERLWLVVQGVEKLDEQAARDLARRSGVGGVVVARVKIDQSYEPRIIAVK